MEEDVLAFVALAEVPFAFPTSSLSVEDDIIAFDWLLNLTSRLNPKTYRRYV